jgi:alanine transaminase
VQELEAKLDAAKANGVTTRALVVINPGNPTGNSLPYENMAECIHFCNKHGLVLMADEVYQENIWLSSRPFHSFKKVLAEMGPSAPKLPLVSFHSTSKGFLGECGLRGGYFELVNFDPDVQAQLLKLVSIGLCSNTLGQVGTGLMVRPPRSGEASYAVYEAEKKEVLESMKRRATMLVDGLNALEGVSCNQPQGAMYAFPQITLPPKAIAAAEAAGKVPDTFYALALLEATGIVVVPGSGFGQKEGTWHFRTTFLPPEEEMGSVVTRMADFHADFMAKYA